MAGNHSEVVLYMAHGKLSKSRGKSMLITNRWQNGMWFYYYLKKTKLYVYIHDCKSSVENCCVLNQVFISGVGSQKIAFKFYML